MDVSAPPVAIEPPASASHIVTPLHSRLFHLCIFIRAHETNKEVYISVLSILIEADRTASRAPIIPISVVDPRQTRQTDSIFSDKATTTVDLEFELPHPLVNTRVFLLPCAASGYNPLTGHLNSSATTTVSRLFTDKSAGAVPPDPASEEASSPITAPQKRPTILQRLHIHSSGRKAKPKPPALDIRPTTSSSLPVPVPSTDSSRAPSSHSDAVTIAEITQMMPQSLSISTPASNSNKRQRSRESRNEPSRPTSAGQDGPPPLTESERLARNGVRMPAYLNKSKTDIQASFQDLEWKQRYRMAGAASHANSPFKLDRSQTVINRNRYGNVQPWENSRIKLSIPIHGSDYINASPIKLRCLHDGAIRRGRKGRKQASGHSTPISETLYIATQGPKIDQLSHFWHMVMQQTTGSVGVIVMLTQCYEGLKEKCARYFPADQDEPVIEIPAEPKSKSAPAPAQDDGDPFLDSDGCADTDSDATGTQSTDESNPSQPESAPEELTEAGTVELLSLTHDASIGCEVRELKLTFGGRSKTIYHYFYGSWVDFGKPEAEDRVALLQLMRVSKQVAGDSPRIVHCSAGVGRTGTWIALDFLMRELEEGRLMDVSYFALTDKPEEESRSESQSGSRKASGQAETWGKSGPPKTTTPEPKDNDVIHDTVDSLRIQRMMMVMNEIQYSFLYEAVKEAFVERYAEKEVGVTVTGVEEPSPKVPRVDEGGWLEGSSVGRVRGEEDTTSEAETEIEGQGGEMEVDPYAAVAPESIRDGLEKREQWEASGHEVH